MDGFLLKKLNFLASPSYYSPKSSLKGCSWGSLVLQEKNEGQFGCRKRGEVKKLCSVDGNPSVKHYGGSRYIFTMWQLHIKARARDVLAICLCEFLKYMSPIRILEVNKM